MYKTISLDPVDNQRLASLCGEHNQHLQQIAKHLDVIINHRGHHFQISGSTESIDIAVTVINELYEETAQQKYLTPAMVHLHLQGQKQMINESNEDLIAFPMKNGLVKAKSDNQQRYLQKILHHDLNFCIGPAGTGKTYLAVACAINALERETVQRIMLVRPAVEAGENLGYLPGDLTQKIEPYLRPLYDALYDMAGTEVVTRLLEQNIIEIVPLAYMRGRTLNDSFVILDESQNTTPEQMKMFLTRLGFGSKAVITGDLTQIDLPKGQKSGLAQATQILKNVKGISFSHLDSTDVVRHSLVQKIIEAYEKFTDHT